MAGNPRPLIGLLPRKQSMRPPVPRPSASRAHSVAPVLQARTQSGTLSPTGSVASTATSKPRTPLKRKERDFEMDGSEETNIHVVVRCRGRNDREVRENSGVVVSTEGVKGKTVELSMGPSALSNKSYHFDKVFSPAADQSMIYEDVVTPLLEEMLHGYNCTIFAYGQTGTGKTYTMSGDMSDTLGLLSDSAGIIPRVLHSLFDKLETDEAESSVKCSFIELYNEELRDLLSVEENARLKIFEDGQKKGHSATIVQGMEESHIKTAAAGIRLLQEGSHKRQVAATKCNDLSSRSHTVFTVTVYIKRTAEDGQDFVSAGKLNLVDLAGSENIQRSGAENKRAAEAGLINKSLLTLGRVINALVDKSSHIPYRESKLTRLLQDSLGGRTKTCIIATVSPAKSNLEETISTLDYAFRAKNIRNKPQINQMISKKTLLKEFTAEIEKLKGELVATRQRNGVYLSNESYEEITVESESRRILSEEQKAKIETMEANLRNKVQELFSLTSNFTSLKKDNEVTRQALDDTHELLEKTEIVLANTRQNLADESLLRKAHEDTESQLATVGDQLITTLSKVVSDVDGLHSKIDRKYSLQSSNRTNWASSQLQVSHVTQLVDSRIGEFQLSQQKLFESLSSQVTAFVNQELQEVDTCKVSLQQANSDFQESEEAVHRQALTARDEMHEVLEEIKVLREDVKEKVGEGLQGLSAAAGRISAGVINELEDFHTQLHTSYSSLGRDFKNIFEELLKHLNTQKAEADALRKKLSTATNEALKADAEASAQLQSCLEEEKARAAAERGDLLAQITKLVNETAATQEQRLISKINAVQVDMKSSRTGLQAADKKYNDAMEIWSQKENSLVEDVLRSRELLKGKMKKDWTTVNEQNTSIQATTRSVHGETVRIVDAQMKDMALQMQALDHFVTRARFQNESHHESHLRSFEGLATSVKKSNANMEDHLSSTGERIQAYDTLMSARGKDLRITLPHLDSTLRGPLMELRGHILGSALMEYSPTGETPQKVQYQYPTSLPRTEPHDKLLSNTVNSSIGKDLSDILDVPISPSKSVVYTDYPTEDVALVRPSSMDGGLREVHVNINASLSRSAEKSSGSKPGLELLHLSSSLMGPPPLKRHATMDSKLPQKSGRGKAAVIRLEGRENAFVGGGRRLRSSPPS
ncbi:kinesin motor protein cin8 [Xylographa opegraphella]|nr:kinesin motor protein cin8 [Xylographa opegraphella]